MSMYDYTKKLERQRDEMLAALKEIAGLSTSVKRNIDDYGMIARKAIEKIEGEK